MGGGAVGLLELSTLELRRSEPVSLLVRVTLRVILGCTAVDLALASWLRFGVLVLRPPGFYLLSALESANRSMLSYGNAPTASEESNGEQEEFEVDV